MKFNLLYAVGLFILDNEMGNLLKKKKAEENWRKTLIWGIQTWIIQLPGRIYFIFYFIIDKIKRRLFIITFLLSVSYLISNWPALFLFISLYICLIWLSWNFYTLFSKVLFSALILCMLLCHFLYAVGFYSFMPWMLRVPLSIQLWQSVGVQYSQNKLNIFGLYGSQKRAVWIFFCEPSCSGTKNKILPRKFAVDFENSFSIRWDGALVFVIRDATTVMHPALRRDRGNDAKNWFLNIYLLTSWEVSFISDVAVRIAFVRIKAGKILQTWKSYSFASK